ncbi:uncharacterized protein BYT42DRAFT_567502, partial [Radiomyces spectabilis]|uniref:uncharacterized protein n=1 Tax=Radiomyces spectabilis TaxID=64574 RepID=UPI002220D971
MNMVINTLALFLSPEERSRSSHAQKNHKYMVNLYLQGILIQVEAHEKWSLKDDELTECM